jgi:hypothetical protein
LTATAAPADAKAMEMAWPIPREPPVISATREFSAVFAGMVNSFLRVLAMEWLAR